ncbi:MAG: amidase [Deltaproteobacteria bacterium]|nr:amidase [Deltaproteobacteria bacterium]
MRFPEYNRYDALGLADLVRRREITPLELVEACIERMERVQGRINAMVAPLYDRARDYAKRPIPAERGSRPDEAPFFGVPFLIKDLVQPVAGAPFTRGSRFFAHAVATEDSELIRRYRRAGLNFVAKTNTPEFGLTPFTEPLLHGPARNPWNTEHTTGGSSGGSAAAVAAGVVPMAHGGDGGGSIRIPASCCGLFGLKPTRARTPATIDAGEGWLGLALDHAISRTVRDSAALLDASRGWGPGDPYDAPPVERPYIEEVSREPGKLRIALCKRPLLPAEPHADVLAAADDAAKLCASLGHDVAEATPPIDPQEVATDLVTIVGVAMASDIAEAEAAVGRASTKDDFELTSRVVALLGRTITGVRLEQARRRMQHLGRTMAKFFERYDVLLTPTLGLPPPKIGALQPHGIERKLQEIVADASLTSVLRIPGLVEKIAEKTYGFIPWTAPANVTGLPAMSVPLWWNGAGLPVGAMFTGRFGDEATLFRLAGQLERARPWADRRPAVHADA